MTHIMTSAGCMTHLNWAVQSRRHLVRFHTRSARVARPTRGWPITAIRELRQYAAVEAVFGADAREHVLGKSTSSVTSRLRERVLAD